MGLGAGQIADESDLRAERSVTQLVADSTTWGATELVAATVVLAVVAGRKYRIWFNGKISSDVAGDSANTRLREDSLTGTQVQLEQVYMPTNSGNGYACHSYAEWIATATGNKTFVFTAQRSIGTGTAHRIRASATAPGYFGFERIPDQ